jgi:hypothetical protein
MTPRVFSLRILRLAILTASLGGMAAGCGGSDSKTTAPNVVTDPLPASTVLNDTPAHTISRLEATLDYQSNQSYAALLTADFRFHFSSATDPTLVAQWGDTWGEMDDSLAMAHLFGGFSGMGGMYMPGATAVTCTFNGTTEAGDPDHPDSSECYRVMHVGNMSAMMEMPVDGGMTYSISSAQEICLVRGDVAHLRPGQPASATCWYVRRWDDLSSPVDGYSRIGPVTNPAKAMTLGSIKAQYR